MKDVRIMYTSRYERNGWGDWFLLDNDSQDHGLLYTMGRHDSYTRSINNVSFRVTLTMFTMAECNDHVSYQNLECCFASPIAYIMCNLSS